MSASESMRAIERFEAGRISPGGFHHADHIRVGWHYLSELPLIEALPRYAQGLLALATRAGHPDRYHETITWAFMFVIHERMLEAPSDDYDTFASKNPDLFVWPGGALSRYYTRDTLAGELARRTFVMPDRIEEG